MPSKNAFLKFVPKCIAQKFSIMLKPSFDADPYNLWSASFCCSINLFNLFCADAESEVDEASKVQFICFACGEFNACAVSLNFCNSFEISVMMLSAVPSGISFTPITVPLIAVAPSFFWNLVVPSVFI